MFGFCELAVGAKGVLLEEEADFVARGEEVVVAYVVGAVLPAGGEFCQGAGGDVEGGEEGVGFVEEVGDGGGGEGRGDDEVAVGVEEGELFRGEAGFGFRGGGHCILEGISKVRGDEVR